MMLFDTHSHIYFEPLGVHGETILSNMREHGIVYAVQIGCNPESNEKVINLAKQYPNLPAVIGIHPTDGQSYSIEQIEREIETLDNIISENRQYIV
jgi:TatD DNase family protein